MAVVCKNCGYELDGGIFVKMPDGSKQARCPKCLAFVVMPAKKIKKTEEEAPKEE